MLERFSLSYADGCTVVVGEVLDQADLLGILELLDQHGEEIVSLGPCA